MARMICVNTFALNGNLTVTYKTLIFSNLYLYESAKTLRISFVGMQTQDVAIRPTVRVILKSDAENWMK